MALSEQSVISRIEILEDGQMQLRRSDRVLKDGVVIAESHHREVIAPGSDTSGRDARVRAVAQAVWTPDVISAFRVTNQK